MTTPRSDSSERIYAYLRHNGGDPTDERVAALDCEGNVHPTQFWRAKANPFGTRATPLRPLRRRMQGLPAGIRIDRQPPMAVPLGHFVAALGFLLAGVGLWLATAFSSLPGRGSLALLHVVLLGFVCITIMGAMTQFVPVWSGASLHSRRLAATQLALVVAGLSGFVASMLVDVAYLPAFATLLLAAFWTFVYNVGRTLARARPLDVTERHFAIALCSFALLAPLGYLLAVNVGTSTPLFERLPIDWLAVIQLHATLAVFGAVLPTVVGALYQLGKMFTQASLERLDRRLQTVETAALPVGVALLALGRAVDVAVVARLGALALFLAVLAFSVVVLRLLSRSTMEPSPMTDRYWLVVASLLAWTGLTLPTWWASPIGYDVLLGRSEATVLLVVGVLGFVVVGTLYHVIPFIIWLDRYSDRVGFEQVPAIDDLYSRRLERLDLLVTVVGYLGLAASSLLAVPSEVGIAGGSLLSIGLALFVANVLGTIHRHAPDGLGGLLASALGPLSRSGDADGSVDESPTR